MKVEWHKSKVEANFRKHRISFEEAVTVFDDPLAIAVTMNRTHLKKKDLLPSANPEPDV